MTFAEHFAHMWWAYVVIFVMITLSAYFSASEIAFNSANRMRLRKLADNGSFTAKTAYSICENFTTSLSAILIGEAIVQFLARGGIRPYVYLYPIRSARKLLDRGHLIFYFCSWHWLPLMVFPILHIN